MNQIVSRGHSRPLTEISFIEDPNAESTILASSAHDKTPQIRNGETGDWIGSFHGHKGAVWSIKVDKRSRSLCATASGDFTAKLWCLNSGKELFEFKHQHVVKSIDFTHDSMHFATGAQDGLIKIFDTCAPTNNSTDIKVSAGLSDAITKINWIDNYSILISKRSGSIELWDIRQSCTAPTRKLTLGDGKAIMDMEVSIDKDTIITASGKQVSTIQLSTLSLKTAYEMPHPMQFNEEGGASLHPNGKFFLAGGSDLWLREFDILTGEVIQTFKGHHGPLRCVRYHPNGRIGASGSEDGTIRLWELNSKS